MLGVLGVLVVVLVLVLVGVRRNWRKGGWGERAVERTHVVVVIVLGLGGIRGQMCDRGKCLGLGLLNCCC